VAAFLAVRPGFTTADIAAATTGAIENVAELRTPEGFLRSWPHHHGIGGAFVALLHVN